MCQVHCAALTLSWLRHGYGQEVARELAMTCLTHTRLIWRQHGGKLENGDRYSPGQRKRIPPRPVCDWLSICPEVTPWELAVIDSSHHRLKVQKVMFYSMGVFGVIMLVYYYHQCKEELRNRLFVQYTIPNLIPSFFGIAVWWTLTTTLLTASKNSVPSPLKSNFRETENNTFPCNMFPWFYRCLWFFSILVRSQRRANQLSGIHLGGPVSHQGPDRAGC